MATKDPLAELEARLSSPNWADRRDAVAEMRNVADESTHLIVRRVADTDSDPDVRASAVATLAALIDDAGQLSTFLIDKLHDEAAPVRLSAALAFLRQWDIVGATTPTQDLWQAVATETSLTVQSALAKILIGADKAAASKKANALIDGYDLQAIRAGAVILNLTDQGHDGIDLDQWYAIGASRVGSPEAAFQLDLQRFASAPSMNSVFNEYLKSDEVSHLRAAYVCLYLMQAENIVLETSEEIDGLTERLAGALRNWATDFLPGSDQLVPIPISRESERLQFAPDEDVAEALLNVRWKRAQPPEFPASALAWLTERQEEMQTLRRSEVVDALWTALRRDKRVVRTLLDFEGGEAFFRELPQRQTPTAVTGLGILEAERGPHLEAIVEHAAKAAPYVAELLREPNSSFQWQSAEWFARRAASLDVAMVEQVTSELAKLQDASPDPDVQTAARGALVELRSRRRKLSIAPMLEMLEAEDDAEADEGLKDLVRQPGTEAPRALVGVWVKWLSLHQRPARIEKIAEKLRRKPSSVLPILEHLSVPLLLKPELEEALRTDFRFGEVQPIIDKVHQGAPVDDSERSQLRGWVASLHAESSVASGAVFIDGEDIERGRLDETIRDALESRRSDRELEVHRRLARHLVEMSEARFFEDDKEARQVVAKQLNLHAVPVFSRQLQTEKDPEVRESLARILANLGGYAAVDALAQAVAGEEAARSSRQDLLAKYYLEPSKQQSDAAARILGTAVDDARRTLHILQTLNFVFTGIGLTALATGFALLLLSSDDQLQIAGGAISIASFLGLVLQVVREPLDRIQIAMNRLMQLEAAFTSFIWELNLNGTFIQSQYVANGILTSAEVGDTVDRIEAAMRLSMDLVSTYADEAASRLLPAIISVTPSAVRSNDRIRVRGMWLSGGSSRRRKPSAQVFLDHRAVPARILSWTDDHAEFRLSLRPRPDAPDGESMHWLSLYVSGNETNALPIRLAASSDVAT